MPSFEPLIANLPDSARGKAKMSGAARAWIILLLSVVVCMTGCSRSPEAKKARHLERGDRYFAKAQYREALIEYANVVRIDEANTRAYRQIALAHYQLGELGQAYPYFLKSKELDPDNVDVRLKLGIIYLLGQRPERAWTEAISALDQDPKNLEVLALLAEAARAQREVETAIRR